MIEHTKLLLKGVAGFVAEPGALKTPTVGAVGVAVSLSDIEAYARLALVLFSVFIVILHVVNWFRLRRICPLGKDCPMAARCTFKDCPFK